VGLRDGALLALVAAGLSAVEIAGLKASAVTMEGCRLVVSVRRHGVTWTAVLPTDLGARLLAWLSECRLWAVPEPVFQGIQGPAHPDRCPLSDAELDRLRQQLYGLADIAVSCYLTKRDKAATLPSKEPSG
jgi:hypothetical protein